MGGSAYDYPWGLAVDASGNAFLTGDTESSDFPTRNAFCSHYAGGDPSFGGDAFVAKFSPSGALLWSTYFGGSGMDTGRAITTDSAGAVCIAGTTDSSDFPVRNAFQGSLNDANGDAFVAQFDSVGGLVWSTYLGGTYVDFGASVICDPAGHLYVAGNTYSHDFPNPSGGPPPLLGSTDCFLSRIASDGTLLWSRIFGGSGSDTAWDIGRDTDGGLYVTGYTESVDFAEPPGWCCTHSGGIEDGFLTKLTQDGEVIWSTYLGGSGMDNPCHVAVTPSGTAYIGGWTDSTDFPVLSGIQMTPGGTRDGFVARFSPDRVLSVTSSPFPGVAVSGSFAGTTDYSCTLMDLAAGTLTVPATALDGGSIRYDFQRWLVNGAAQPWNVRALGFAVTSDTTLTAIYKHVTQLSISGPSAIFEGGSGSYRCRASFADGSSAYVTAGARWADNSPYAAFSKPGVLKTRKVRANQRCSITVTYGGKRSSRRVTIRNR